MAKSARRYAELVKMQNLIRTRDEAELESSRSEQLSLEQEDDFLFSIMSHKTAFNLYDPMILHKRLQRNAKLEAILEDKIQKQRHIVLQATKRHEALEDKHRNAKNFEERKEIASMLEEYITAKTAKDTSLG